MFSRRKSNLKNAVAGVVENKVMSPVVKFVDMRAAAGQLISIVGARMGGENDSLPSESCTRIHPVRRVAAAEATKEMKAAATGKP